MNRWITAGNILLMFLFLACSPSTAETWYVRHDGGTRYSAGVPKGQCDGLGDAPYPGKGVNRHCAFNDVRYLWQDGTKYSYFHYAWIIAGGDTVIIRGSIADGVSYRVGWPTANDYCDPNGFPCFGYPVAAGGGAPSGSPPLPSGTAGHPTRILGGNHGACSEQSARTQLHGGYGVYAILDLRGTAYVDLECLDLTDFSGCGSVGQTPPCNHSKLPYDDYANYGLRLSNGIHDATFTDIRIHGLALEGILGPVGDKVTFTDLAVIGNAGGGWNADDGTVGSGNLVVQNFEISWNGCAEEYPMVHRLPYAQCTDDWSGDHGGSGPGYGDGFGTTTKTGTIAWHIKFEDGTVSYNTQDGLDALHASGAGSTTSADRILAYGNMGNQIKIGSDGGSSITNSVIYANCAAMSGVIPGTPSGYNRLLSDFCRADDEAIILSLNDGAVGTLAGNTIFGFERETNGNSLGDLGGIVCAGKCTSAARIIYADNILVGFDPNHTGRLPGQYYLQEGVFSSDPFRNPGSIYANNVHAHVAGSCPDKGEANALCRAPQLVDTTWHPYGYGNVQPSASSNVIGAGLALPFLTKDYAGSNRNNPPTIGAYEGHGSAGSAGVPRQSSLPVGGHPQTAASRSRVPVWACSGIGVLAILLLARRTKKKDPRGDQS